MTDFSTSTLPDSVADELLRLRKIEAAARNVIAMTKDSEDVALAIALHALADALNDGANQISVDKRKVEHGH
jgi:hypothetical protein